MSPFKSSELGRAFHISVYLQAMDEHLASQANQPAGQARLHTGHPLPTS